MVPPNGLQTVRTSMPVVATLAAAMILTFSTVPGGCETCEVPSATYPSIESALEVINCTEIVLASDLYFGDLTIDRTLVLRGTTSEETTIVGRVVVQGETTAVELAGLSIAVSPVHFPDQCLVVEGDADALTDDVVVSQTDLIFLDGFELGNDSKW